MHRLKYHARDQYPRYNRPGNGGGSGAAGGGGGGGNGWGEGGVTVRYEIDVRQVAVFVGRGEKSGDGIIWELYVDGNITEKEGLVHAAATQVHEAE